MSNATPPPTDRFAHGRPATAPRAPRGATRTAKGWVQEAALRMLHNNLDAEIAENWQDA